MYTEKEANVTEPVWYDLEEVAARPNCGDACEGAAYCKRVMACVWEGRCKAPASVLGYEPSDYPRALEIPTKVKQ